MTKTGRVKHPPNPSPTSSPLAAGPVAARGALSPFAQGGKIARRGFRYQDRWVLIHLSRWLGETGFGGYRNEGADDVEAWWNIDGQPRFERFQLKDTKIDKATLAGILQGFEADDARFPSQWKMFRLIASACAESLTPLPSELESLRNCFETYTAASAYYQDALNTFKQRLAKLGITADAQFLCERVTLELDETIPRSDPPWLRFLNRGGPGDYPNDLCSIFHWEVGRSAFLYTGDITAIGWQAIRDAADSAKLDLRCDIFTVPHSGSLNSSLSPEFLKSIRRGDDLVALVRPRERYGLPRREAMDMLRKTKVQIEVARERPLSILLDQQGIHVE